MLTPIKIENDNVLLNSFRAEDVDKLGLIASDIYSILSDEQTLKFLPGKRLKSIKEAEQFLKYSLLSFHAGKNYLHFIRNKDSGRVIGMIDIISPELAKEYYSLDHYPYFIEFYLKSDAVNRKVMTSLIPKFMEKIFIQSKNEFGAVVNRNNIAAQKVLTKCGFIFKSKFDPIQDLYIAHVSKGNEAS